ncbi:MAG: hypothetical protein AB1430_13150 [Pseudomonadota bacterium]
MGRLCRAAKRLIDDALEEGEEAARRARRAARAARDAAKRKVDDTKKALDELPPKGQGTEIQEEMRKALEELLEDYEKELREAVEALRKLGEVASAYDRGKRSIDEAFAMLDERDGEFRDRSFEEASTRILALLEARFGKPPRQDPVEARDPCPPFASAADLDLVRDARPAIDLDALALLLSDTGLDRFARSIGMPSPSEMDCKLTLPARVFYGAVAPGLTRFELARDLAGGSAFAAPLVRELMAEAIELTARVPAATLQRERAFQLAEPVRLAEFAQLQVLGGFYFEVQGAAAGEVLKQQSERRRLMLQQKAFVLGRRARARNLKLAQGLLAVFGLDFLLDEEDQDALDKILNFYIISEWVLGSIELLALIVRLLSKPKLWEKLVKRYGRFGAIRFLAGLGGRLVPALMAAAIAYAWYDIYQEWLKDAAEFDRDLRRIYDSVTVAEVPDRDEVFMKNLGYIP